MGVIQSKSAGVSVRYLSGLVVVPVFIPVSCAALRSANVNVGQGGAIVVNYLITHGGNRCGNHDGGQGLTTGECFVTDGGNRLGNGDGLQLFAACEGVHANALQRSGVAGIGKGDRFQVLAVRESKLVNVLNGSGNGESLEALARSFSEKNLKPSASE